MYNSQAMFASKRADHSVFAVVRRLLKAEWAKAFARDAL